MQASTLSESELFQPPPPHFPDDPMTDEVTRWIRGLARKDPSSEQAIFERYFEKLARLARRHLGSLPRRVADEEDVALSAMNSFCCRAAEGRFPQLEDRDDLWRLLVAIASRKAVKQIRLATAQRRGGGKVRGNSVFVRRGASEESAGIENVMGDEFTPESAAVMAETRRNLLECLHDNILRDIAVLTIEGHTTKEIASKLGCTPRTVERKLERIRRKWQPFMVPMRVHPNRSD
jgi:RNA polymerase sigma factor (sigma-70 family)